MNNYTILVGKPGSGKTTYINDHQKQNNLFNNNIVYINAENLDGKYTSIPDLVKELNSFNNKTILVDGLFLTNSVHRNLYEYLNGRTNFIVFNGTNDILMHNDKVRGRDKLATVSIKNLKLETDYIRENKLIFQEIEVKKAGYLTNFYKEYNIDPYIYSDTWTTGGSYGTCWDTDGPTEVDAEPDLQITSRYDYSGFYDILEKLYPGKNTTELENIAEAYADLTDIEETSDSDYYGGCQYYNKLVIKGENMIVRFHELQYGIPSKDCNDTYIEEFHPEIMI